MSSSDQRAPSRRVKSFFCWTHSSAERAMFYGSELELNVKSSVVKLIFCERALVEGRRWEGRRGSELDFRFFGRRKSGSPCRLPSFQ